MILKGIYKSTRIEITMAFLVPVVLIGIASALATNNLVTWLNLIPGAGVLICLILISNSLNNLVDKDIDIAAHESHNAKSEKYHPLITQEITTHNIFLLLVVSYILLIISTEWLIITTGRLAGYLMLVGLFFAVEYNLPPLTLSRRPFGEISMLLPSTIIAVAGIQYILVQEITMLALFVSASFGMFSSCWFLAQAAVDHDSDKAAGKITTPVWIGIDRLLQVAGLYCIASFVIPLIGVIIGIEQIRYIILPFSTLCAIYLFLYWLVVTDEMKLWKRSMLVSFIYGVGASIIIFSGAM